MISRIPRQLQFLYSPASLRQGFYLGVRWRLCPFELVETLVPEAGSILDFGCGYGLLSNFLALKSPRRHVLGVDISEKRIRIASRSVRERRNIAFVCGDFNRLEGKRFDGIVMTDVLHHLSDTAVGFLLGRMHESMARDGLMVILDVDRTPFWKFCSAALIDRCLNPGTPLFYRSRHVMGRLLSLNRWAVDRWIPAHKDLPLSDMIYVCHKVEQLAAKGEGEGRSRTALSG
jgi:2-polyprenyl-3-methyl-5-hydroxy-6-metoxy-1,4-benzoquinol methylase